MDMDQLYSLWRGFKMYFRFSGNMSPDALHIHVGLAGFFLCWGILRKSERAPIYAWLFVFALQFANECLDIYFDYRRTDNIREWNSIKDFVLTMFWPSVLLILIRIKSTKTGER